MSSIILELSDDAVFVGKVLLQKRLNLLIAGKLGGGE
jgi:hypothetical protein